MKRILGAVTVICVAALWAGAALADGDDAWVTEVTTDDLNRGSGTQTNANDWHDMFAVNVDGNQLTGGGINSNGGDRNSDDVVILSDRDSTGLERWLEAEPGPDESPHAGLAHAALSRIPQLVGENPSLGETAEALARRIQPLLAPSA